MNARLHRPLALLLVLASLMASGLARAETPAAVDTAQATQAQPAPTHKDTIAWQRVGAPTSLEA